MSIKLRKSSWHFISLRFLSGKRRDFRKKPSTFPYSQFGGIELFLGNLSGFLYLLQSGLQKVDDQLDRVIEQVCRDSDTPLPVSI